MPSQSLSQRLRAWTWISSDPAELRHARLEQTLKMKWRDERQQCHVNNVKAIRGKSRFGITKAARTHRCKRGEISAARDGHLGILRSSRPACASVPFRSVEIRGTGTGRNEPEPIIARGSPVQPALYRPSTPAVRLRIGTRSPVLLDRPDRKNR